MSPSYNVMLQLGQIQCCLPFLNVKKIYLKLILQSHFCNLRLDLCHCDGNIKINYVIIRFDGTRVTHLGYVWSRLVIQCTTDRRKTIPYREMWAHWHQLLNHCRTRNHINPLPPKVVNGSFSQIGKQRHSACVQDTIEKPLSSSFENWHQQLW